jgi:hypothetical protein
METRILPESSKKSVNSRKFSWSRKVGPAIQTGFGCASERFTRAVRKVAHMCRNSIDKMERDGSHVHPRKRVGVDARNLETAYGREEH